MEPTYPNVHETNDFLWWSYHVSGENPAAWQVSAKDLLDAAMAVKAKVQPGHLV